MPSNEPQHDGRRGTLYVVATPIGNLEDISFRAIRILKEVDLIAAEDTRHSRKLLTHYGIATPLTSYHEHNEGPKSETLLAKLREGGSVALVSDAGTPAIADPGYLLVKRCREEGLAVETVPGPCALVAALSISGMAPDRFAFHGFAPTKSRARREFLSELSRTPYTAIFYEAPHRLNATLRDLQEILPPGQTIAVARELTKVHEEFVWGTAAEVAAHFTERVRGEIVVIVPAAMAEVAEQQESVLEALKRLSAEGNRPMKEIVKQVAREQGLSGSEVYRESLKLKNEE